MSDWISFYDFKHSVIYVNARHRDVHYRTIAEDIRAYVPSPTAQVLDYGCGEAASSDLLAAAGSHLTLVEAAPNVRAALAARYAGNPKISVFTPEEAAAQPAGSFDLIVLHSVAQYLTPDETDALLAQFRRLLKSTGTLIVSDVIPLHVPAATDAWALLRFAAANGFLLAAVAGLVRTRLSLYWRLRMGVGLTRYTPAAMKETLAAAGFAAERAPDNLGHNRLRMAFIARPR